MPSGEKLGEKSSSRASAGAGVEQEPGLGAPTAAHVEVAIADETQHAAVARDGGSAVVAPGAVFGQALEALKPPRTGADG